jgi:Uma2 family endonuclease
MFITARRISKKRSKKALTEIPDLVVEVHSPRDLASRARYDEAQLKIRLYQIAGVKIVWAINPASRTVEVYHPGQLEPVAVLGVNNKLDGEDVIPGFELQISALFE